MEGSEMKQSVTDTNAIQSQRARITETISPLYQEIDRLNEIIKKLKAALRKATQ